MSDWDVRKGREVDAPREAALVWPRIRKAVKQAGYAMPKIRLRWFANLYSQGQVIYAVTWKNRKSCTIWVDVVACRHDLTDTLIHEVAHALAFQVEGDTHPHDHSDLWGTIYGRLYRAYHDSHQEE